MATPRSIRTWAISAFWAFWAFLALALGAGPAVAATASATASVTIEPAASVGPRTAFRLESGAVSGTLRLEAPGAYSLTLPEGITLYGADRSVRVPVLIHESAAPGGATLRLQMPVTSPSGETLTGRLPVLVELH